jgi:predicted RNA-binding Zn-ribbon protein involved in translation (DUF1610 family)
MEMKLKIEDQSVNVSFDGRKLWIDDGEPGKPKRASLDAKRIIPLWNTVLIVLGIILGSAVVGSLLGRADLVIISISAGVALGVIVFLALSRMEQVLLIEFPEKQLEFRGSSDDLRKLYYSVSKVTIRNMKEKERELERSSLKQAGVNKGETFLKKDELNSVKGDLRKSVVLGKRMVTQICPDCGNDELYYEGGLMTGHVYHCKKCDYVGSFVLERELDLRD